MSIDLIPSTTPNWGKISKKKALKSSWHIEGGDIRAGHQHEDNLPHRGLVDQILSLPVILHVWEIGGKHGIKGEDLLLDGAAIGDLQIKIQLWEKAKTSRFCLVIAAPGADITSPAPAVPWGCVVVVLLS